ncbi:MAG: hypothetical protein C4K60_01300 [Ideonella sp. MAG2]|nr:MAG: hypothetical protein C4K60_01300 [Ideonella sp. MAG2]
MRARAKRAALPKWLTERTAWWAGFFLLGCMLLAVVSFVLIQLRELENRALERATLNARALEDHANRAFSTVDVVLSAVQDTLAQDAASHPQHLKGDDGLHRPPTESLSRTMVTLLQGLPFVRSLSLVSPQGKVTASSQPDNLGAQLDLAALGTAERPNGGVVPRLMAGRDLGSWALDRATVTPPQSSQNFIPVLLRLNGEASTAPWLVATINPDYFANQHELTLDNQRAVGALLAFDGVLLTGTTALRAEPGRSMREHVAFKQFLPAKESASLIDRGLDGHPAVLAFRSLRRQPLVVMVEQPYDQAIADIWPLTRAASGVALVVSLVILALASLAARSLRSHEQVTRELDAANERVVESERELRVLIEGVREWIFRTDASGRVSYVNPRWQQITQRPDEEALGVPLHHLVVERDRAAVGQLIGQAARGPQAPLAVELSMASGLGLPMELSLSALHGPDGSLQGFAGFGADVSARESARRRLQAQLDFTAQLIEATPTPIFVKDELGRLVMVNKAWTALTGLCLLGQAAGQADEPAETEAELAALNAGQVIRREGIHRRADGALRHTITTKVSFTQVDGTPAGIIGNIVDVTEFREAERATRLARDAAENSNRIKTEFIANMSHELRTPLQSIIGFSELGLNQSHDQDRLHTMFDRIHMGGQRMLALVNDLLDVAKLDGEAQGLQKAPTDLVLQVREVLAELEPLAKGQGVVFKWLHRDEPGLLPLDAFLRQGDGQFPARQPGSAAGPGRTGHGRAPQRRRGATLDGWARPGLLGLRPCHRHTPAKQPELYPSAAAPKWRGLDGPLAGGNHQPRLLCQPA